MRFKLIQGNCRRNFEKRSESRNFKRNFIYGDQPPALRLCNTSQILTISEYFLVRFQLTLKILFSADRSHSCRISRYQRAHQAFCWRRGVNSSKIQIPPSICSTCPIDPKTPNMASGMFCLCQDRACCQILMSI